VATPKSKNEFVGVNIAPPLPYFAPKSAILGQKALKIHANINMPISACNVRESPEFLRRTGVEKHDDDVRFQTGSRNKAASHMRIAK